MDRPRDYTFELLMIAIALFAIAIVVDKAADRIVTSKCPTVEKEPPHAR